MSNFMSSIASDAMRFAFEVHAHQRRKYSNAPYVEHLAQVAGLVAHLALQNNDPEIVAVAWLHDCIEDQGVTLLQLEHTFSARVAQGVSWLSAVQIDASREERKATDRERLARAPDWVQSIKCADIVSNAATIEQCAPDFAKRYLVEKKMTLDVLTLADTHLRQLAYGYCLPRS